ncbi:GAF domain-containing sensor histidine kinase [Oryzicola mucosus]|uniref:histidine kinase n=1 Tax=Oryzicola mucosus TaxID=2767425 RepID=A0A8J6PTE4_9HYPH|nr:GAF domain-containing sensor histidine kinase [Oryzicola mucosus]MBD0413087.1 GAF domain-containing sensor histidine kinase [Oryzicola mucosus]
MNNDFQADIDAIGRIAAVPTILDVVCRTTGMRFAAVARVTEDRWITCDVLDSLDFGLSPGDELKVETTICHEIRQSQEPVVIDNVAEDGLYCGHQTPAMYGFQSYISMPIVLKDGQFFGTLCALDPLPAKLKNPETIGMFQLFAQLIASQLEADEELSKTRTALQDERETAEIREQFIAVLGHDLRNPVASLEAGTKLLFRGNLDDQGQKIVTLMQGSLLRMRSLIDNVIDFARARLGDGLNLQIDDAAPLIPVLEQVVAEIRSIHPGRTIETDFRLAESVVSDQSRVAQLFGNLLGNAITHGSHEAPIRTGAEVRAETFELWVENAGPPIAEEALSGLFNPFVRGATGTHSAGLGLGLYIASEIARGHGGRIDVTSDSNATRFTFRMPM